MKHAPKREREIPQCIHGEKVLLGAVLLDNAALDAIRQHIEPEDFSLSSHRIIWNRMTTMRAAGKTVDLVTLSNEMYIRKAGEKSELDSLGELGVSYLASLTDGLPRNPVVDEYFAILREKRRLRGIIKICAQAQNRCYENDDAKEIGREVWTALKELMA